VKGSSVAKNCESEPNKTCIVSIQVKQFESDVPNITIERNGSAEVCEVQNKENQGTQKQTVNGRPQLMQKI
jgi:hypothetical protein